MLQDRNLARVYHVEDFKADGWPEPDMSLLRDAVPAPPFPEAMMGKLWPIVSDLAVDTGAPVDFVAVSILTMAASIIGAKRRAQPFSEGQWREAAILWTGLVCPPSINKSPALRPLQAILNKLQAEYLIDYEDIKRDWKGEVERAKAEHKQWQDKVADAVKKGSDSPALPPHAIEPREPLPRRFYVNDCTPEALAHILVANPQGVITIADELSSFLASFDRYNNSSEGFWLTAYNGDPYAVDRKGSPEPVFVPCLGVSVLGGIQPDKFALAFKGANVGIAARFLWVWPDPPAYARPTKPTDLGAIERVFRSLDTLPWGSDERGDKAAIVVGLSKQAEALFEGYDRFVKAELREGGNGLLMSFVGKTPGMAARFALVVEYLNWAVDGGPQPTEISSSTVETVCSFLSEYARPMAERVYGDASRPPEDHGAANIGRWLLKARKVKFNSRRDILRHRAKFGFHNATELDASLQVLIEAGWVRDVGERAGGGTGRKSKDFTVNPQLHGAANA